MRVSHPELLVLNDKAIITESFLPGGRITLPHSLMNHQQWNMWLTSLNKFQPNIGGVKTQTWKKMCKIISILHDRKSACRNYFTQLAEVVEYKTAPLQRGKTTLIIVLDMTLNNLMVRFQWCWSFGDCGSPLHCHRSQVNFGLEWKDMILPY